MRAQGSGPGGRNQAGGEGDEVTAPTLAARAGGAFGLRPTSRAAVWYLAAGAAAIAVYFVLPGDAQSIVYVLLGLSAAAAIVVGATWNPVGERLPWYLFAGGILLQVAGDAVFGYYEIWLDREPPTPSVADVLYLSGYPLLAAGAFLLLRRLGGATSRAALLDTIIVRSVLVTALTLDIGRHIWWPSKLASPESRAVTGGP